MKKDACSVWAMILVVATIVLLFLFSGQNGTESSAISQGLASNILEFFHLQLTSTQSATFHYLLRRAAHFGLFALLGFGLMALLHNVSLSTAFLLTTLLSMAIGAANEYHQLLGDGRTARLTDVVLDTAGAIAGCLLYCAIRWFISHLKRK